MAEPRAVTRPPFSYYGGKTSLAKRIVALLPGHDSYVEPFAGSLAVLLAKPPVKLETVNDLDGDLMTFWRVLRERPDDLIRACALTPHSRAEHDAAYDLDGAPDDLERARRVWTVLAQGRAGTLRRTGWRYYIDPNGTSSAMPRYLSGYVDRMAEVTERLARVSLECRPALEVVEAYGAHPSALLYIDAPYLRSTRGGLNYRFEMPSEAEHRALASALAGCRAAVVVSGYAGPLYDDDLYAGWHRVELAAWTGNGGTRAGGTRTEVLWANRPLRGQDLTLPEDGGTDA